MFRPDLDQALAYSDGSKGGRPPFDAVLMFKILMIQTLNNLSDERTEYLINDRQSFMRFLGLGLSDRVPDAKTVWLFRERLTQAGAINGLFNRFDAPYGTLVISRCQAKRHNPEIRKQEFKKAVLRSLQVCASIHLLRQA